MKRFYRVAQAARHRTSWLRHDSIRLAAATAVVGAALFGFYSAIGGQAPAPGIDEAALAERLTDTLRRQAEARRLGSIVFSSAEKYCEEYKFDNATGYVVDIALVDCEERLAREATAKKEAAKSAGMKGMLTSFRK